jgi:hypothetical protein
MDHFQSPPLISVGGNRKHLPRALSENHGDMIKLYRLGTCLKRESLARYVQPTPEKNSCLGPHHHNFRAVQKNPNAIPQKFTKSIIELRAPLSAPDANPESFGDGRSD